MGKPRSAHMRSAPKTLVASLAVAGLLLAACGSSDDDTAGTGDTTPAAESVKVGVIQSLSGTMSISEVAVKDAEILAIEEINAAGGVLGKQLDPIIEDGESKPEVFATKVDKLLNSDKVAVVFGGWTSSSRKAMKPVVEGAKGLLFYPVQYEGLEVSPNIFYTGATTNQQIIPGLDYLKEKGLTKIYLVGSDYVFPRTANKEIKAYAAANGLEILGEDYVPLASGADAQSLVQKVLDAKPQAVFNTLNGDANVAFFKELKAKGNTPDQIQTISVSIAEEETAGVGVDNLVGHLVAWNYYQTTSNPANTKFVAAYKAKYGADEAHRRPHRGRLQLGLHLEGGGREGRHLRRARRHQGGRGPRPRHARGHADRPPDEPPRLQDGPDRHGQQLRAHRRGLELGLAHRARPLPRHLRLGGDGGTGGRRGPRRVRRGQGGRLAG